MERTLNLTYDEIVIGADLSALCYSYIKKAPLIYLRKIKPHQFDETFDKWNQTMFFLSLHNLVPFSNNLQSIRFETDNILKAITKENFVCSINFKKCVISDDFGISGINYTEKHEAKNNLVLDWFKIDNLSKTKDEVLLTKDYFLKKVKIYTKEKFIIGSSYLTNEQLNSGDHSEVVSRLTVAKILKENGYSPKNAKSFSVKLEKREIFSIEKNQYDGLPDNISILNYSPREILDLTKAKDEYFEYLERLINGRQINS